MSISKIMSDMMEGARQRDAIPTAIDDFSSSPRQDGQAYQAYWVVTAAFAHPLWSQYFFSLCDLTTPLAKPPFLARPGMTHELMVYAIDPAQRIKRWADRKGICLMAPQNQGYQFPAADDAEAEARVTALIERIIAKQFSPDTDWTPAWDAEFADGVSLKMNAFERFGATLQ